MTQNKQGIMEKKYLKKDAAQIICHSMIVSRLVTLLGMELGIPDDIRYELAVAAMMHDIGKLPLDSYFAETKDTRLQEFKAAHEKVGNHQVVTDEIQYARIHSMYSYDILKKHGYSDLVLDTVMYHHENYDGTGYPEGLRGTDIPLGARILRVCDMFAALIGKRIYREAFDRDEAMAIMIDEIKNYDMRVFLAFQRVINEIDMDELIKIRDMNVGWRR